MKITSSDLKELVESAQSWQHSRRIKESQLVTEEVTKPELDLLEKYMDRLWAAMGVDVVFTRHFLDRVNDPRNKKPITIQELARLFAQTYLKYGKVIPKLGVDAEGVLKDMKTDINVPFVLSFDPSIKTLDLVAKTVMRKPDFKSPDRAFVVSEDSEGEWLYDGNGNSASVKFFKSKMGAQRALNSLVNCKDCINCVRCTNCVACIMCVNCRDCSKCRACTDCSFSRFCENCKNCSGCNGCHNSTGCTKSEFLHGCDKCHRSYNSARCVKCIDCDQCFDCVGLTGMTGYRNNKSSEEMI